MAIVFGHGQMSEDGTSYGFPYSISTSNRGKGTNDFFILDVRIKEDENTPWAHEVEDISGVVSWNTLQEDVTLQVRVSWYDGKTSKMIAQSDWQDLKLPATKQSS